jgi:hypothetical protein
MARGFSKQSNQVVKADSVEKTAPAKKVIEGNDLRTGKK